MPAKKPVEQLHRTNKPAIIDPQLALLRSEYLEPPKAPANISDELQVEWRAAWTSDLATRWHPIHDVRAIARLFWLYEAEARFTEEGMAHPVSLGSKNQEQLSPLLKHAKDLRAEMLALEDRFGLNSMARMRLNVATDEAEQSLDKMNQRLTDRMKGSSDNRPDPRLTAIDATAT